VEDQWAKAGNDNGLATIDDPAEPSACQYTSAAKSISDRTFSSWTTAAMQRVQEVTTDLIGILSRSVVGG
jgi:hypothetical protein